VRQPQVAGSLLTLATALLLAAPVVLTVRALVLSAAFLVEFLTDGHAAADGIPGVLAGQVKPDQLERGGVGPEC
jgi:hypothetical protein